MRDPTVIPASTAADYAEAAALFRAYAATLPIDLGYQGFEAELSGLPGKYAPPRGAILLARGDTGEGLGCVALRPLEDAGACEMKRLFVRPAGRGLGLGRALAAAIVAEARSLGYAEVRLDTLDSMAAALALYDALGFVRCDPYYAPTPPGTVFMKLTL